MLFYIFKSKVLRYRIDQGFYNSGGLLLSLIIYILVIFLSCLLTSMSLLVSWLIISFGSFAFLWDLFLLSLECIFIRRSLQVKMSSVIECPKYLYFPSCLIIVWLDKVSYIQIFPQIFEDTVILSYQNQYGPGEKYIISLLLLPIQEFTLFLLAAFRIFFFRFGVPKLNYSLSRCDSLFIHNAQQLVKPFSLSTLSFIFQFASLSFH